MSATDRGEPLLTISGLSKVFPVRTGLFRTAHLYAVRGVDLALERGRTLAVVGESGSGKTTLGRLVLRLIDPTTGSIRLEGIELTQLSGAALRAQRKKMQMVFQDPRESLSPWQTVGQTIREPIQLHERATRREADRRVAAILERVGLTPAHAKRYPHQLSGGQQQRVGIARAVVTNPGLVVLDEPTSSLDMSVQAQILQLLESLQRERRLSYIFISHNLSVVRFIADDLAVMYLGQIMEEGPVARIFERPAQPYTQALLAASPRPDPHRKIERTRLAGEQPSPMRLPPGCPLFGRCPIALPPCETMPQRLVEIENGHSAACWRVAPPPDLDPSLRASVLDARAATRRVPDLVAAAAREPSPRMDQTQQAG
jgi:oligopeptide/dipeptide ABC transporter ATP-binding protein